MLGGPAERCPFGTAGGTTAEVAVTSGGRSDAGTGWATRQPLRHVASPVVRLVPIDPPSVPATSGGYVNAMAVEAATRLLFTSGQIPQTRDGHVPADAEEQCRLIWAHITALLTEAGMTVANLVKVTTFLGDRAHAAANTAVRDEVLGKHRPALTVIVTGIFDPAWLLEIEAVAAD